MIIFEIKNLKDSEETIAIFSQILANFASQSPISLLKKLLGHKQPSLFLEIFVFNQNIHFYLICEDYLKSYFKSLLSSHYPKGKIIETNEHLISIKKAPFIENSQLVLKEPYYLPLNTYKSFKEVDPMGSILSILSKFSAEEIGLIQLALVPISNSWQKSAQKIIDNGLINSITGQRKPLPNESLIREKISVNGFKTGLRILTTASEKQKARTLINNLTGSFGVFAKGNGNSLFLKKPGFFSKNKFNKSILERTANYIPKFQVLNIEEITTIFHPPDKALSNIKNISWGGQLFSEPPENLPISFPRPGLGKLINFFAKTEFKNKQTRFGIKKEDRRRHMYIIGKTGTGKTTLIANMAINDMKNGKGLAVIDPHGDLCNVLLNYVPKNRINDVAYLDPSDTNYPFRLNPLEVFTLKNEQNFSSQAELTTSGIVSIFHKLYYHSWGPRLEYILRNTIMTLTQIPNSTLIDVPKILSNKSFRKRKIEKLKDSVLIHFWNDEFANMSEKLQSEAISPILNKVGQFVGSPMIRNILAYPKSTVNFSQMMNKRKIIIINLSQGKLGEDNAALMGAMFITKMQLSAMSRVYQEEAKRRDFYLYVDEFQNFATRSFIKILSEARKYRLNLILANQYIEQVDKDVQKAIFGNVGTLISFLVGAEDAKSLSFEFGENYTQKDFVSLDSHQILLKMAINNLTSTPFYAQTLPLPDSANQNREKIIKVSRERYTKTV